MKLTIFALASIIATGAFAEPSPPVLQPVPPPASSASPTPADAKPVQLYGDEHPNCTEWTNGCIVCQRQSDKTVACSLVGIACTPSAPTCAKTMQ